MTGRGHMVVAPGVEFGEAPRFPEDRGYHRSTVGPGEEVGGMETLYGFSFMLVLASPVTAIILLFLVVVIRSSTSSMRPITRATVRTSTYVAAGGYALVSLATLGLWSWSWRYFDSFDDPMAEPMPSWIDPTIDLGIGVTGISFVLAALVAGVATIWARVGVRA